VGGGDHLKSHVRIAIVVFLIGVILLRFIWFICHSTECHSDTCGSAECHSAECHSSGRHSFDHHSTECHFAECYGAIYDIYQSI